MKTNLTIIFIFFLLSCGGDKSTGVAVIKIDYIAEHQLFIENLLELNPELNPDTLETRIKKEIVVSDGTEYYQISKISLNNLGLSNLPTSISYLDSLTTLDISNNQLSDLPDAICSLDIIDGPNFIFSENHFCDASILPPCIIQIINFTEQKCDYNYDEEDFQFIQELIQANNIDTNGVNAVNEIYDNVTWVISENTNEYDQYVLRINKIEWDDKNISTIPDQIGFLDSLSWLELENNIIETIPGTIGGLIKLEYLQLYNNRLTYLPKSIGYLKNLRELYIHNNSLDTLAFNFTELTSLRIFWVENNNLSSLPQTLCSLISSGSLPNSTFYYYWNNICTQEDACNMSNMNFDENEQNCDF
jgi:Leucine-rich repeat (LRR) protein